MAQVVNAEFRRYDAGVLRGRREDAAMPCRDPQRPSDAIRETNPSRGTDPRYSPRVWARKAGARSCVPRGLRRADDCPAADLGNGGTDPCRTTERADGLNAERGGLSEAETRPSEQQRQHASRMASARPSGSSARRKRCSVLGGGGVTPTTGCRGCDDPYGEFEHRTQDADHLARRRGARPAGDSSAVHVATVPCSTRRTSVSPHLGRYGSPGRHDRAGTVAPRRPAD